MPLVARLIRAHHVPNSNLIRISGGEAPEPRCNQCNAQPKLVHRMLDPLKRAYAPHVKCPCGEQVWTTDLE